MPDSRGQRIRPLGHHDTVEDRYVLVILGDLLTNHRLNNFMHDRRASLAPGITVAPSAIS